MSDDLLDRLQKSGDEDKLAAAIKIINLQEINFRLCGLIETLTYRAHAYRNELQRQKLFVTDKRRREIDDLLTKETIDPPRESAGVDTAVICGNDTFAKRD